MNAANESVGFTKDAGYQIGVRRTIPSNHTRVWEFLFSNEGMNLWLGPTKGIQLAPKQPYQLEDGTCGEVRVFKPGSHIRITWQPGDYPRPSTMQVRVIEKGDKTTIAFHQENLPDSQTRAERRAHFEVALDQIRERLIGH